jgi:NAD(P)-dependent dehydrogenase (short-subunit alcohol dehydrogenase family)
MGAGTTGRDQGAAVTAAPLEGKVALVTGGGRGLGRVACMALARAGADLVLTGRDQARCEAAAREIEAETGRAAFPYAAHMGEWDAIEALVDAAYERFGRLDVLVNNAGTSPAYESPAAVTEALWRKTIDVNLSGPFRLTALVGTRMAEGDGGAVVNISSVAAEVPTRDNLPYAAAKAGLNSLTLGFARAFGPEVRVNAILCGNFLTDMFAGWDPGVAEAEARGFALRRNGEPDELAGTLLYLATDASSYTTGSLVHVDGGYLLPSTRAELR